MRIVRTKCEWRCVGLLLALAGLWVASAAAAEKDDASAKPRPIRLAVFDVDSLREVGVDGSAITDQLNKMLAALPQVTLVNRDQIKKVADEHADGPERPGRQCGRREARQVPFGPIHRRRPGEQDRADNSISCLKIVDVETTVQTTVSAKAATESGFEAVLERLDKPLADNVRQVAAPHGRDRRHRPGRAAQAGRAALGQGAVGGGRGNPRRAGRCAIRPPKWPSCSGSAAWDFR